MDLRVVPGNKAFPGVEIHANTISGILDGTLKWESPRTRAWNLATIAVLGLLLAAWLPFAAPLWASAAALGLLGLAVGLDIYAWLALNLNFPGATLWYAIAGLFILNMSYGFFVEARSKLQITRLFGQYVPPELARRNGARSCPLQPARPVARDDSAVFRHPRFHQRFGRKQARQIVNHGHLMMNGKRIMVAGALVKAGDVIEVRERSRNLAAIQGALEAVDSRGIPDWLELDKGAFKGIVRALPAKDQITLPVNEQMVVELYSR